MPLRGTTPSTVIANKNKTKILQDRGFGYLSLFSDLCLLVPFYKFDNMELNRITEFFATCNRVVDTKTSIPKWGQID